MIPNGKILQAAVPVQKDAASSDPSHWHGDLGGSITGESALRSTCEKFFGGIRKRIGNRRRGGVCGWRIRLAAGQRDCRSESSGRGSNQEFSAGGFVHGRHQTSSRVNLRSHLRATMAG